MRPLLAALLALLAPAPAYAFGVGYSQGTQDSQVGFGGRQGFYYGAKAEAGVLGFLRLALGYQKVLTNMSGSHPLDEANLTAGASLVF